MIDYKDRGLTTEETSELVKVSFGILMAVCFIACVSYLLSF